MATYYISPSGNDTTGNGSSGNPWLTLAKAYASSTTSDTIVCKDGTYTFATDTMSNRTIQAENSGLAIFDGGGGNAYWVLSGTFNVIGLVIQNIVNSASWQVLSSTSGTIVVTNCKFKTIKTRSDNVGLGAVIGTGAGTTTVTLNVSHCGFWDVQKNGGTINSIFGCYSGTLTGTFTNCTIVCNTSGANATVNWFGRDGGTFNATVTNCIFSNYTGGTINAKSGTITLTATYSDFYNTTSPPSGTGVITTDPKLIDPTNGDFHLAHDSPALGMGTN